VSIENAVDRRRRSSTRGHQIGLDLLMSLVVRVAHQPLRPLHCVAEGLEGTRASLSDGDDVQLRTIQAAIVLVRGISGISASPTRRGHLFTKTEHGVGRILVTLLKLLIVLHYLLEPVFRLSRPHVRTDELVGVPAMRLGNVRPIRHPAVRHEPIRGHLRGLEMRKQLRRLLIGYFLIPFWLGWWLWPVGRTVGVDGSHQ
jgi:hypothetical protein